MGQCSKYELLYMSPYFKTIVQSINLSAHLALTFRILFIEFFVTHIAFCNSSVVYQTSFSVYFNFNFSKDILCWFISIILAHSAMRHNWLSRLFSRQSFPPCFGEGELQRLRRE